MNNTDKDLERILNRIDNKSYGAYKEIRGSYQFPQFTLSIDYVQGDPFASPSRMHIRVPQDVAAYPPNLYNNDSRRLGLESALAALFSRACHKIDQRRGSGKSGLFAIDTPGQEILERTAIIVTDKFVEARFLVGLPAQGRRVRGHQAADMLVHDLPKIVTKTLNYANNPQKALRQFADTNEDADFLRHALADQNLIAFIANGSTLPRLSGIDDRPLTGDGVVTFTSPKSLQVSFDLPNWGPIHGMGIPAGVTLIVGGGFHGKSTLLTALERGVYNHKPGDGRDFVVSHPDTVKIRAEDGRYVAGVNITPFINNLPYDQQTNAFTTLNASGSTSQAANIIEALEVGAKVLLIDEDTAATNFMIRDQRMQALIHKDKEPITPFIDKVRQLYDEHNVSTILVIGGSGDYFDVADHVIALDSYIPSDVTAQAKAIAAEHQQERTAEGGTTFGHITPRTPRKRSLDPSRGKRDINVKTHDEQTIQFGTNDIDLTGVSQIVDKSQTKAIAEAIIYAWQTYMDDQRPLATIIDQVMADIDQHGLDILTNRDKRGDLARFRRFELAAAINRLRTLQVK
ncbi:MAG TPA: ABC-ATPase domain-containing protein [Anaerolineae bacterium]|nr:ABC-ATPase domain-containing protein [Anaerolineae bacterium]